MTVSSAKKRERMMIVAEQVKREHLRTGRGAFEQLRARPKAAPIHGKINDRAMARMNADEIQR